MIHSCGRQAQRRMKKNNVPPQKKRGGPGQPIQAPFGFPACLKPSRHSRTSIRIRLFHRSL